MKPCARRIVGVDFDFFKFIWMISNGVSVDEMRQEDWVGFVDPIAGEVEVIWKPFENLES
jgi:hypothetical protein